jgi:hypothetical protein
MMIVEKFCQLFTQALVTLAPMAEDDSPFEQRMLHVRRQLAPKTGGSGAEDREVTGGIIVFAHLFKWLGHRMSLGLPAGTWNGPQAEAGHR